MATILVLAVVVLLVVFVAIHMVRNKKKGKTSCGYNCQGCAMRGECHKKH
jgi:hypothetical protein